MNYLCCCYFFVCSFHFGGHQNETDAGAQGLLWALLCSMLRNYCSLWSLKDHLGIWRTESRSAARQVSDTLYYLSSSSVLGFWVRRWLICILKSSVQMLFLRCCPNGPAKGMFQFALQLVTYKNACFLTASTRECVTQVQLLDFCPSDRRGTICQGSFNCPSFNP